MNGGPAFTVFAYTEFEQVADGQRAVPGAAREKAAETGHVEGSFPLLPPGNTESAVIPYKIAGNDIEDRFVKRVRETVEQNLAEAGFTVEKLSDLVFMSHSQLYRKPDALTGCSPNRFIRIIRLTKAKELLQDPGRSIASVAMECGFDDPGYFARVFKQEYKVTPQKWRGANN